MGDGHDRAAAPSKRGVEVFAAIDADASHELNRREASDEKEVHEHAAIVLKRTSCDCGDLRIRALASKRRGIVVESRPALPAAEPIPRGTARSGGRMAQTRRDRPQDARTDLVASA